MQELLRNLHFLPELTESYHHPQHVESLWDNQLEEYEWLSRNETHFDPKDLK